MKELVELIAKALVDNPDAVKVNEIEGEKTSVIELSAAKEDLGKILGKEGGDRQGHEDVPHGRVHKAQETQRT